MWPGNPTARLIRTLLRVVADFARASQGIESHGRRPQPFARRRLRRGPQPRVPHVSHQNGLDADVYYPHPTVARRRLRGSPTSTCASRGPDRFVSAGARFVFVAPNTPLTGPAGVVQAAPCHDNHRHVRFAGGLIGNIPPGQLYQSI